MIDLDVMIGISIAVVFASAFINVYTTVTGSIRAQIIDKVIAQMPCTNHGTADRHFIAYGFVSYPTIGSDGKSYIKGFCNLHNTNTTVLLSKKETRQLKKDYKKSYKTAMDPKGV